ncbi:MAG: hypothetical protein GX539_12385 [Candidatus Cloacimonetes bacterium]|jgi:hypothetical protein|nr:hypothetical protein [Candidatus Cloacimonadota bacterium]
MATAASLETGQRLPLITIQPADGGTPVPLRKAGRLATVLVTVHPDCAECSAYLESLRDVQGRVEEWDGRVIAARATEELAAAGVPAPAVLIADQWGELFVVEPAGADHAFIEPDEVVAWLRYLAIQCPECQGEAL